MTKEYQTYKKTKSQIFGQIPTEWEYQKLKRVTRFVYGDSLSDENRKDGEIPVYGSNGIVGYHDCSITKAPCLIIGRKCSYGKVNFSETECFPIDTTYYIDHRATKY